jgi:hypothetical protein
MGLGFRGLTQLHTLLHIKNKSLILLGFLDFSFIIIKQFLGQGA